MSDLKNSKSDELLKDLIGRFGGSTLTSPASLQAVEAVGSEGLPGRKTEAWKYTGINAIRKLGFRPSDEGLHGGGVELDDPLGSVDAHRLVFVNGRLRPDLSDISGLEAEGVAVSALDRTSPDRLVGSVVPVAKMPFANLNTAFLECGAVIRAAEGSIPSRPIHLQFFGIAGDGDDAVAFFPRVVVDVEAGANLKFFESHVSKDGAPLMSVPVIEMKIARSASVRHDVLQAEGDSAFNLTTFAVSVGEGATYAGSVVQIGGAIARRETHVAIDGPHAQVTLDGAYVGRGEQVIDNTTFFDHKVPDGVSRQKFRGVLDDKARGVFQGKVLVREDAQRTDGSQSSKALLLSRGSEIDTKPELEIYADDVQCSHGATAGEIDADQLFYLQARGIPYDEAKRLLVHAFLTEVLDGQPDEKLRDILRGRISSKLEGGR